MLSLQMQLILNTTLICNMSLWDAEYILKILKIQSFGLPERTHAAKVI